MNKLINYAKWLAKIILIFVNYPLLAFKYNFDFQFLNTLYMNGKFISKNRHAYNSLKINRLSNYDFSKESKLSESNQGILDKTLNSEYFSNLHNFGYGLKVLETSSFNNYDYLKKFHLYPANVFVLDSVSELMEEGHLEDGVILDYPSGIGNLFLYLNKFVENVDFIGIDNFEQISREDINEYQKNVGSTCKTLTFEEYLKSYENNKVDIIVSIELNLDLIIENILSLRANFLIFETMYISRQKNLLNKIYTDYSLYSVNESISIFKRS